MWKKDRPLHMEGIPCISWNSSEKIKLFKACKPMFKEIRCITCCFVILWFFLSGEKMVRHKTTGRF